jgi:hypothetical protein
VHKCVLTTETDPNVYVLMYAVATVTAVATHCPLSIVMALQLRMTVDMSDQTLMLALPDLVACIPKINRPTRVRNYMYTVFQHLSHGVIY